MSEPTRYRVADIQAQMTLGGGVLNGGILVVDPAGPIVAYGAYAKLQAENERLKAEVERLTFDPLTYLDDQGEWMPRHIHLAAVERLKAEVENSNRINTELLLLSNQQASEVRRLKTEVERLTKLCQATSPDGFIHIRDINAAKEGKPSA